MHVHIPLLAVALILGGCTATVELPAPAPDHPANPAAEAAPMPVRSVTLTADEPVTAPPEQPMAGGHEHMHH